MLLMLLFNLVTTVRAKWIFRHIANKDTAIWHQWSGQKPIKPWWTIYMLLC